MQEAIEYFFNNLGYDKNNIAKIVNGSRYLAVMNKNGQIGVCATLGKDINIDKRIINSPDIASINDRIFLSAYYNSIFNYQKDNLTSGDLMDIVNFKKYKKIVMIGYFKPIVERMRKIGVQADIFDLRDKQISLPIEKQKQYLEECDAAIVTATSIYNNTFSEIAKNCNGDIFILGPSATMHEYFFSFPNVKAIFGSIFKLHDSEVLNIIGQGLGTRIFLKLGEKKVFEKHNSMEILGEKTITSEKII